MNRIEHKSAHVGPDVQRWGVRTANHVGGVSPRLLLSMWRVQVQEGKSPHDATSPAT